MLRETGNAAVAEEQGYLSSTASDYQLHGLLFTSSGRKTITQ